MFNNEKENQFNLIQEQARRMLRVSVYVDTSIIPRSSTRVGNRLIDDLYNLQDQDKIEIISMQGSAEEIHPERNSQGADREENRNSQTFPIATEDVTDDSYFRPALRRDIFDTMFQTSNHHANYFERYSDLSTNDQNDYRILIDAVEDSNGDCFFVTLNSRDFINNGRSVALERTISRARNGLRIRLLCAETLNEINSLVNDRSECFNRISRG